MGVGGITPAMKANQYKTGRVILVANNPTNREITDTFRPKPAQLIDLDKYTVQPPTFGVSVILIIL